ncbi:MAG TPA: Zn-ribbon domain-containing OB-fold protein [Conexivisphaerales archaeon]|nr:Zn-ribbon domain-containing OB-fold protein [Conexivisphaerales archaeon]
MSTSAAPAHWRRMRERYRLTGSKCETCGRTYFPSTRVCPNCRRKGKVVPIEFSGRGKVYSYTVIHSAPKMMSQFTPYAIALVQLDEGPKVLSQVVDCDPDKLEIGMEVEACFRKLFEQDEGGIISYGFKFRPLDDSWRKYYRK